VGQDSVVGIETRYGLNSPGIKSWWDETFCTCPDQPWGPPSLLYNGYGVFPGGKDIDAWTPPPFNAEANERAELYLYSTLGLRPVYGSLYLFYNDTVTDSEEGKSNSVTGIQKRHFASSYRKLKIHNPETNGQPYLSIKFQHKPQDAMSSRMLRAEVEGKIANFLLNWSKYVVPWRHLPQG
jgi:hypothetical protein